MITNIMSDSPLSKTLVGAFCCLLLSVATPTPARASDHAGTTSQCCTVPEETSIGAERLASERLADAWGVKIEAVRVVAAGAMVDFRYRVIDAQKAAELGREELKPFLVDEATGAKLFVPNTPKAGPLRQTAQELSEGKIYWMFFSNLSRAVKSGSVVTVVIGDFKIEHLVVQ